MSTNLGSISDQRLWGHLIHPPASTCEICAAIRKELARRAERRAAVSIDAAPRL